MIHWTISPIAVSIDVVGLQQISVVVIIHITQLFILHLHPRLK